MMYKLHSAIIAVLYNNYPLTPEEIQKEIKDRYGDSYSIAAIRDAISVLVNCGELLYSNSKSVQTP